MIKFSKIASKLRNIFSKLTLKEVILSSFGIAIILLFVRSCYWIDFFEFDCNRFIAAIHLDFGSMVFAFDPDPLPRLPLEITHGEDRIYPDWSHLRQGSEEAGWTSGTKRYGFRFLGFRAAYIPFPGFAQYWLQIPEWFLAVVLFFLPARKLWRMWRARRNEVFKPSATGFEITEKLK